MGGGHVGRTVVAWLGWGCVPFGAYNPHPGNKGGGWRLPPIFCVRGVTVWGGTNVCPAPCALLVSLPPLRGAGERKRVGVPARSGEHAHAEGGVRGGAGVLTRLVRTIHWWRERRGGDRILSCGAGFRPGDCWSGRGLGCVSPLLVVGLGWW